MKYKGNGKIKNKKIGIGHPISYKLTKKFGFIMKIVFNEMTVGGYIFESPYTGKGNYFA